MAVVQGDSWAGFEIQADAYPEWAGAALLRALREHGLDDVCRKIREARLFPTMRDRATASSHAERGDLTWVYVIDPERRKLRVYCTGAVASAHPLALRGSWREVSAHDVTDEGRCQPMTMMVKLTPPWPLLRVADTWDLTDPKETDRHAAARLESRRKIERDCAAAGLTAAEFVQQLERAFAEALTASFGPEPVRRVYVAMECTSESYYWSVQLGGLELRYPGSAWSRWNAVERDGGEGQSLRLFVEPDRRATLDARPEAIIAHAAERAGLREVLISALPRAGWFFWFFDLVRARAIPDPRGEALERATTPPALADDWEVFTHLDGRIWAIRRSKNGFQLRLGDPSDDPIFRDRVASAAGYQDLVQSQLSAGFVRQK